MPAFVNTKISEFAPNVPKRGKRSKNVPKAHPMPLYGVIYNILRRAFAHISQKYYPIYEKFALYIEKIFGKCYNKVVIVRYDKKKSCCTSEGIVVMFKSRIKSAAAFSIAVFLISLMLPLKSAFASSSSKARTYRIGANALYGISKTENGYSGLACSYLNAISKYNNDKYIYVEGTAQELFEKLKSGEIDVIPCVTETERDMYERLLGGENGSLFKKAGSALSLQFNAVYTYDNGAFADTTYNDVSAIRRMKIGYLAEDEQSYFKDGKCYYSEIEGASFVAYKTETTLRSDFISGKIDAVLKDCLRSWSDETIVYRSPARSGYFITRASDTELESKLVDGLTSLFTDYPTYYGDVYQRYVSNYGSQKFAYSTEASEFKKNHPKITIGFNLQSDAMDCYDTKSNSLSGIPGTIMEDFSQKSGLGIKLKAYSDLTACMNALTDGEVDMVYGGVRSDDASLRANIRVSSPVVNPPLVIAGKSETDLSGFMTIAVIGGDAEAQSAVAHSFSNANIVRAESLREACQMTMNGECNAACVSGYDAMYLKNSGFPKLDVLRVLPVCSTECFALRREDSGLCEIADNTLLQLNSSDTIASVYNMMHVIEDTDSNKGFIVPVFVFVLAGAAVIAAGVVVIVMLESRRRADIDPLTGGATRQTFIARSQKLVKKSGNTKRALAVFDIDKFKFINDRLGYEEGNRMLERMFKTLGDHMENGETYARLSDDNFACCIIDASDSDITNRLNDVFEEFERRNSLFVSYPVLFSAGVCRLEQCTDNYGSIDFNTAIDRCNIAKRTIKSEHLNSIAFYDGKIREKTLREKDFENVMPTALEKHEFLCYIQPKYGTKSRRIEGGEALIRWKSSDFGFVFPDEFIPIAEKNGFVIELDFFILEEVCKAMRRWLDAGFKPVPISVNQSRAHMAHDDYIWRLREIVDKYAIPYEYIELEITETIFTDNADLLLKIVQKLHDIGFQLSIDDFGSGYSSLNMLKDIPADVVKIDREFFNGTVNSDKGRAVISTVVDLAKKLRMHVISEGVETIDQVEFLDKINCDLIQGYYFAKPMPLNDFEKLWFSEMDALEAKKVKDVSDSSSNG